MTGRPLRSEGGLPGNPVPPEGPGTRTGDSRPIRPRRLFEGIGLTRNPFCVLAEEELLETVLSDSSWAVARDWLASTKNVIEFVGERGWGKSTHLRVLRAVANERGVMTTWSYIEPGQRSAPWPQDLPAVWIIDEVDRLSARHRRAILEAAARQRFRVALGTHVSASSESACCGATCLSVQLAPADARATAAFVRVRLRAARLATAAETAAPCFSASAADALLALSAGSLREVEAILYEVFQRYAYDGRIPARITEQEIRDAAATVVAQLEVSPPGS